MDIRPIAALRDTAKITKACKESSEPIFITKNGYGELVIMDVETFERKIGRFEVTEKVRAAERDVAEGKTMTLDESIAKYKVKHES